MADRSYAAAVTLGLAGAGLAAVAASREWASTSADSAGIQVEAAVTGADSQPLVPALALVALAAWGAVLVMRGRARRVVAGIGLLAAAGAALSAVLALSVVQDDAVEAAISRGATGDTFDTALSAWYFLTVLGAVLAAAAFVVAVLRSPRWPEMGAKYDAPTGRPAAPASEEDMWRALDEGRDPTS